MHLDGLDHIDTCSGNILTSIGFWVSYVVCERKLLATRNKGMTIDDLGEGSEEKFFIRKGFPGNKIHFENFLWPPGSLMVIP